MKAIRRAHSGRALAMLAAPLTTGMLAGCAGMPGIGGAAKPTAVRASLPASASVAMIVPVASRPPASIVSLAMSSLTGAKTVHLDVTSVTPSGVVSSISDDATASGGRQKIFVAGATATIMLIDGVGYVEGNEVALVGIFRVPDAKARAVAFRWITVHPGEKVGATSYATITGGMTVPSLAGVFPMTAPFTLIAPATINGEPSVGVRSPLPAALKLPASAHVALYVSKSEGRPVLYKLSGGGKLSYRAVFSQWDQPVDLTVPANTIPASSL